MELLLIIYSKAGGSIIRTNFSTTSDCSAVVDNTTKTLPVLRAMKRVHLTETPALSF